MTNTLDQLLNVDIANRSVNNIDHVHDVKVLFPGHDSRQFSDKPFAVCGSKFWRDDHLPVREQ